MARFFRVKPLHQILADTDSPDGRLKRALGPVQLTALGVGAIIGAGIFTTVGTAAAGGADHTGAGPALMVSFVLVALACGLAALCYAEFAAMVPVAGSAYTYAYATLGELVAWLIGWDLILEYAVGNVAVAISWSAYFQGLVRSMGIEWPLWLGTDFRSAIEAARQVSEATALHKDLAALGTLVLDNARAWAEAPRVGGIPILFNAPAFIIVALITWILVVGVRESARFNTTMVALKLGVIAFFMCLGALYIKKENWVPFAPNGFAGISSAAAIIFFAYIGFDAVSTAAEEARDPQRDLPIGIIASLVISTVVYVGVAFVLTGLVKWNQLGTAEPLAYAFSNLGFKWAAAVVCFGALFANASVLMAFQLGQPRIFFSMARDGLLPGWAAKVHPRYRTPHVTTILTGVLVAAASGICSINEVVELTNIGTLFAFVLVAVGVVVLRRRAPDAKRPFRTPLVPWLPLAAVFACGYLMTELPLITWVRFLIWMLGGFLFYLAYGFFHSRLAKANSP